MESKLIILRGNSGSGKTTIANRLQQHFGHGTLLVSQDVIRREMLMVLDREGNPSIELTRRIAEYGKGNCEFVIVEGIFNKKRYGDMLRELIQFYDGRAHTYYFDLSFEETVKRHNTRDKKKNFGEDSLRIWWNVNDVLDVEGEILLKDRMSESEIMELVLAQVT